MGLVGGITAISPPPGASLIVGVATSTSDSTPTHGVGLFQGYVSCSACGGYTERRGSYAAGDTIAVLIEGGVVRMMHNDNTFATAIANPPYYGLVRLSTVGSYVEQLSMSPLLSPPPPSPHPPPISPSPSPPLPTQPPPPCPPPPTPPVSGCSELRLSYNIQCEETYLSPTLSTTRLLKHASASDAYDSLAASTLPVSKISIRIPPLTPEERSRFHLR
ncbi:MAG: hypothetical protein SGPRY_007378, partial [Prymnesium sp.]